MTGLGTDPLPAGQVWGISPGDGGESSGLVRIEVTESAGGGVRILNQSPPAPFRESLKVAEQNLYSRARELVGDRNPREHEFAVQLRAMDANKSGAQLGVGDPRGAVVGPPRQAPARSGFVIAGNVSLGGSIEPIHNPIDVVELALAKGANGSTILMPVSSLP